MKIQPLADRIIVEALEAQEKTAGGIVLPETAKEKPQEGRVIAVGKGKVLETGKVQALEITVGDRVMYGKYSGTEISGPEGEDLLIMKEDDVLAVVK